MVSLWLALCLLRRYRLLALAGAAAILTGIAAEYAGADDRYATPAADEASELLILYRREDEAASAGPASDPFTPSPTTTIAATPQAIDASSLPSPPPQETTAAPPVQPAAGISSLDAPQPPNPLRSAPPSVNLAAHDSARQQEPIIEYDQYAMDHEPAVAPASTEAKPLAAATQAFEPQTPLVESPLASAVTPVGEQREAPTGSRRLAPPSRDWADAAVGAGGPSRSRADSLAGLLKNQAGTFKTAGVGLSIVLGLFVVSVWLFKPAKRKASGILPTEAFEVLGRAPLVGQSVAHLLRLGNKLVLVSITPDGAQTLAEVTDPMEVGRLAGLCAGTRSGSPTAEFQQVLAQLSREPARGFLGRESVGKRRT